MKKIKKRFALLTALVALFAMLTAAAYAESTDASDAMSLTFIPETQLTVYVDGSWDSTRSDTYAFGDYVLLTAPEVSGKSFSHWEADGAVVSYNNPLELTMNANTTLYAVYADAAPEAKPVAGFTSITRTDDGERISFQAIASGDTAGIVYSASTTGEALKIGGKDVTDVKAVKLTGSETSGTMPQSVLDSNKCWMLQITPTSGSTVYHARAYVTVNGTTTYGDVKDVKLSDLESGVSMVTNLGEINLSNAAFCTVTFDPNGGTGTMAPQGVVSGTATALNANTFTREGYTFTGWATEKNGSVVYKDGGEATLAEDVTLYAQWKSNASPAPASPINSLTVTSEIGTIKRVTLNGRVVSPANYTVVGGNVYFTEAFLATLKPGTYIIKVTDGARTATATYRIAANGVAESTVLSATTGDAGVTHYGVLAAAAAVAICAVLACAWVAKKRKAA